MENDDRYRIWLAGFFDGEGSVGLALTNNELFRVPRISLTQKDEKDLLLEVKSIYGGTISKHSRSPRVSQYHLSAASSVVKFLEDILPYTKHTRKKQRIELVLPIARLVETGLFHNTFGKTPPSEELLRKRLELEVMYDRICPSKSPGM